MSQHSKFHCLTVIAPEVHTVLYLGFCDFTTDLKFGATYKKLRPSFILVTGRSWREPLTEILADSEGASLKSWEIGKADILMLQAYTDREKSWK